MGENRLVGTGFLTGVIKVFWISTVVMLTPPWE